MHTCQKRHMFTWKESKKKSAYTAPWPSAYELARYVRVEEGGVEGRMSEHTIEKDYDITKHLQCVAVCCSVLQCVAVCSRVLQSTAV